MRRKREKRLASSRAKQTLVALYLQASLTSISWARVETPVWRWAVTVEPTWTLC